MSKSYISKKRAFTPIWPMIVLFLMQLRLVIQEKIHYFFFKPDPYVSAYSLRTEKEHADIRAKLTVNPYSCNHRKGQNTYFGRNKYTGLSMGTDFNITLFQFVNGKKRIRCNTCGKKWFEKDPDWSYAVAMVKQSSNVPASSEVMLQFKEGDQFKQMP